MLGPSEVLIAVPVAHAEAVMAYRDDLIGRRTISVAQGDKARVVNVRNQGPWTEARLHRLRDVLHLHLVRGLLDACAASPDEWIPLRSMPKGDSPYHFRNQLAAFSKLLEREFGEKYWPMEWRKHPGSGYEYLLPADIAEWWRDA